LLKNGQGIIQDYIAAVKWFKKAADQGNSLAQYNLGVIYKDGQGVAKNITSSAKWFKLAAEQGDAQAQNQISLMYGLGEGVIQDNIYAYMWANLSVINGNKGGGKLRDIVSKKMSPSDISKAQELTRECMKKKYKGC
jgi:TPR repeat protein